MTIDEAKKIGYGDFNWASVSKDKRDYLLGIARGYLMGWNAAIKKSAEIVWPIVTDSNDVRVMEHLRPTPPFELSENILKLSVWSEGEEVSHGCK